jgi:hypothetical protein
MDRKNSKYFISKLGYMGARLDLYNPAVSLLILEEMKDIIKASFYKQREAYQAAQRKQEIEIAKANTKKFVSDNK